MAQFYIKKYSNVGMGRTRTYKTRPPPIPPQQLANACFEAC